LCWHPNWIQNILDSKLLVNLPSWWNYWL